MKVKSNKQGICPFCGESNLEYGAVQVEGEMCYFPWQCLECKHEGEEWYSMEFMFSKALEEKQKESVKNKKNKKEEKV